MKLNLITGIAAWTLFSGVAMAQQTNCDCREIVGSCQASIRMKPTGGPGSYGAELTLVSTAPICSKVSYFVDSTPYFTILSRGNTDQDSIFGTKPITQDSLSEVKCQVCKQLTAVQPQTGKESGEAKALQPSDALAGHWRDGLGTHYQFSVSGERISGQFWEDGHGRRPLEGGALQGDAFDFTFTDYGSRSTKFSCKLASANQAQCSYKASGFLIIPGRSGATVLTKQ